MDEHHSNVTKMKAGTRLDSFEFYYENSTLRRLGESSSEAVESVCEPRRGIRRKGIKKPPRKAANLRIAILPHMPRHPRACPEDPSTSHKIEGLQMLVTSPSMTAERYSRVKTLQAYSGKIRTAPLSALDAKAA